MLTKSSFDDSDSSSDKPKHSSTTTTEDTDTFDDYSPDDSQEYFPLTTSVTRELRLELENLDRKVFGDKYVDRLSDSPSSPECESKVVTRNDGLPQVNENQVTGSYSFTLLTPAQGKPSSGDIFIWENPLHQTSPKNIPDNTETPDEQIDIDYDAPTMVNETSATKTVTPIRIINSTSNKPEPPQRVIVNSLLCQNGTKKPHL